MPISRIETNSIAPSQTLTTPIIATTMGVGGATPAGSGSGITFPAAQSASSDVNTLDDYEEGTWTPVDGSGAGLSFSSVSGQYTKIGNIVICTATLTYPSTANGNAASIGGLPFSSGATSPSYGGYTRYTTAAALVSFPIGANASIFTIYAANGTQQTNANVSTKRFDFVAIYQTT